MPKRPMNQRELARELGLSASAVSKGIRQGMPTTSAAAARRWRAANVKARSPAAAGTALTAARVRREEAAAGLAELKARRLAGTLIDAEAVAKTWTAVAHDIRAAFLQLPARLAPMLVGRDLLAIRNALDQEVRRVLERLADADGDRRR